MKTNPAKARHQPPAGDSVGEILVLSDGRIFAHNLSPALAELLVALNPADKAMRQRARQNRHSNHELSD